MLYDVSMVKKPKIKLYTLKGLADHLGTSHGYMRQVLLRIRKGEIDSYKGFRFFGEPSKTTYAYQESELDIEIVDTNEEKGG